MLRAARPKQWTKNVLVFAAPGAAGVLGEELGTTLLAFCAFCLAASGTYYLNDLADREQDRRHPAKRQRAIAAGLVSPRLALAAGLALLAAGLAVAYAVNLAFLGTVALYLAFTTSYSVWLKHVPVLDIGLVAAGFVIRAVAGGVAVDVPISRWFLIVTSFASLFMVVGRRQAEQGRAGLVPGSTRTTLSTYSTSYLQSVSTMAAAITLMAYCLWAFEQAEGTDFPWYELTIIPFVLAILRYALLLDAGRADQPEDVFLSDRPLQFMAAGWAAGFALAVYVGS
jgi:decaprenyl-phosphate phosphoribosyltransferase